MDVPRALVGGGARSARSLLVGVTACAAFGACRPEPAPVPEIASAEHGTGTQAAALGDVAADASDPGDGAGIDTEGLLRALEAELGKQRPMGVIERLRLLCTPASLDAFALELARQWQAMGEPGSRRWGLALMGLMGGEQCVDFIGSHLAAWSHPRAVQGLDLLEQIAGDAAAGAKPGGIASGHGRCRRGERRVGLVAARAADALVARHGGRIRAGARRRPHRRAHDRPQWAWRR